MNFLKHDIRLNVQCKCGAYFSFSDTDNDSIRFFAECYEKWLELHSDCTPDGAKVPTLINPITI